MQQNELKNKTALVTGANRGIGEAYVRYLVKNGAARVYAGARDLENLKPLCDEYPDVVKPLLLDVTNDQHINALKSEVTQLDILVNNAGTLHANTVTSEDAIEAARIEMETNYFGPMKVTQAVLKQLEASPRAVVINVSSIAGISNFPSIGTYSASKAAIHSYTQGLRAILAKTGIPVIGVYPGPIDTRMAKDFEYDKPAPSQVAEKTFEAIAAGEVDVFPDDFSQQMYTAFLDHPHALEKMFADMLQ